MKHLVKCSALFLGLVLATLSWAHHPAEGIVSDDIWNMVDELLEGSPHLTIDFDDIMGSMGVVTDPDGDISLVTSIVVDTDDVMDYLIYIDFAVADMNRVPSGRTDSGTASTMVVETTDLDNDLTEIAIYEPVGAGESQDDMLPKKGN
jgi:hypothetical protein